MVLPLPGNGDRQSQNSNEIFPDKKRRRCRRETTVGTQAENVEKGDHYVGEHPLPIRLRHTPTTGWVCPFSRVKLFEGWGNNVARNSEQRTKGVERIEATIEAKREFVEIGLQVLVANAVVSALKPSLQVGENEMGDGQVFLGNLWGATFG
jgi:hypothetical protein